MGKRALSVNELLDTFEDKFYKISVFNYPIEGVISKDDVNLWIESLILIRQEMDELYGKIEEFAGEIEDIQTRRLEERERS